jgi:hypothetical protein
MTSYFDSSAVLKLKPFKTSVAAILKELSVKQVLEEEFLLDPAGFMAVRLHGHFASRIPRARLNSANKLLFSLMGNKGFVEWLDRYQERAVKVFQDDEFAVIDKSKIRYDFAKAIAEFGDADIINSALVGNVPQSSPPDPGDVFDVIGNIAGRPDLSAIQTVTSDLTAIGTGHRRLEAADVAVEIETLIYAVAAAAVFVVVVAVVGRSAQPVDKVFYREMFVSSREIANIADALVQRSEQLRAKGLRR